MNLSELNVLVVDDSNLAQSVVFKMLREYGIKSVTAADSGEQALEHLKKAAYGKKPFDLIICDWHMPGISGLDLLKICRDNSVYREISFIMVTGKPEMAHAVMAISTGADHYLPKPLRADDLKAKLMTSLLKRHPPLLLAAAA